MTILEMIARGVVGVFIIEAATVENRHHEAYPQGVRECDAENERYDPARPNTGKAAKNIGSGQGQDSEERSAANDVEQPESRRFAAGARLGRDCVGLPVGGHDEISLELEAFSIAERWRWEIPDQAVATPAPITSNFID
jgi:hypothetical protein